MNPQVESTKQDPISKDGGTYKLMIVDTAAIIIGCVFGLELLALFALSDPPPISVVPKTILNFAPSVPNYSPAEQVITSMVFIYIVVMANVVKRIKSTSKLAIGTSGRLAMTLSTGGLIVGHLLYVAANDLITGGSGPFTKEILLNDMKVAVQALIATCTVILTAQFSIAMMYDSFSLKLSQRRIFLVLIFGAALILSGLYITSIGEPAIGYVLITIGTIIAGASCHQIMNTTKTVLHVLIQNGTTYTVYNKNFLMSIKNMDLREQLIKLGNESMHLDGEKIDGKQ